MTIDWSPFIYALPGAAIAYWGWRKSQSNDAVALQSGAASNGRAGMNILVDQLQEHVRFLTERLDFCTEERDELKLELARWRKKYGGNDENGPA